MKIFIYGFVWKSTEQLLSANKQRKILHWEHCILQIILHNLNWFLFVVGLGQYATWPKQTSVTENVWVGFLPVVGASKLFRFGSRPLELDGFILLARIRASDSSRLNWSRDFWFLCGFPFWRKCQRCRTDHWSLPYQWDARISFTYQWDARISFGTSALSCMILNTKIGTCPPGRHLPGFWCIVEQFEDMECFFSPSPFRKIFATPKFPQLQQSLMRDPPT